MTAINWIMIGAVLGGAIVCILFPGIGIALIAKKIIAGAVVGATLGFLFGLGGGGGDQVADTRPAPDNSTEGIASVRIRMTIDTLSTRGKTIHLQVYDQADNPVGSVRQIAEGDERNNQLVAELNRLITDIPVAERGRSVVIEQCSMIPHAITEQIIDELRLAGLRVDPQIVEAEHAD